MRMNNYRLSTSGNILSIIPDVNTSTLDENSITFKQNIKFRESYRQDKYLLNQNKFT